MGENTHSNPSSLYLREKSVNLRIMKTTRILLISCLLAVVALGFICVVVDPGEHLPVEWQLVDSPVPLDESFAEPGTSDEPYQPTFDEALLTQGFHGQLQGNDLVAFHLLKREVARIAAGERSSTEIEIPVTQLIGKLSFTAAELGVSGLTEDGVISQEALDAVRDLISVDYTRVIETLLADCPFEMYWYDKTEPVRMRTGGGCIVSYHRSRDEYVLTINDNPIICLPVSRTYAAGEYEMLSPLPNQVAIAAQTARGIVAAHADLSTYEKLVAYRQDICQLASYDNEAEALEPTTGVNDAWQLISVFDGNPSTNVVCEGYAKAFKYLCDLSDLPDVECKLVWGDIVGGVDGGSHMWNLVTMPDGVTYLVDVTNCDEGTVGADDWLFLKGCASGDVGAGYVFDCSRGEQVTYHYLDRMHLLYPDEELAVSGADYQP